MNKTRLIFAVSTVVLLAACDRIDTSSSSRGFQLIAAPNGDTFLLDSKSGKVSLVTRDGMRSLSEAEPILQIGHYYPLEDASGEIRFAQYKGKGSFGVSKVPLPPGWSIKEDAK